MVLPCGRKQYLSGLGQEGAAHGEKRDASATQYPCHYQYATLIEVPPQIRLLTLLPGAADKHVEGPLASYELRDLLEGTQEWEALSYCWGDSTELQPLSIAGKVLEVTKSLYVALGYLRRTDNPRTTWIDQICVNQKDLKDRSHHVQHMRLIYENVGRVTAWLGEGDSGSKIYVGILRLAKNPTERGLYPYTGKPTMEEEAHLFTSLASERVFEASKAISKNSSHDQTRRYIASLRSDFCTNAWFGRIWIVEEAVLAKRLILQCGLVTVDWNVHSIFGIKLLWAELVSRIFLVVGSPPQTPSICSKTSRIRLERSCSSYSML